MVETLDAALRDAERSVTFRKLRTGNMSAMIRPWRSRGFPRTTTLGRLEGINPLEKFYLYCSASGSAIFRLSSCEVLSEQDV